MTLVKRLRVGAFSIACATFAASTAAAASLKPLTPTDAAHYAMALESAEKGDFIDAQLQTVEVKDKSLVGWVSFHQLMHPSAHKASFEELTGWLSKFRDLPLADRVFSLASKRKPAEALDEPPAPDLTESELARVQLPATDRGREAREAFYSGNPAKALELAPAAGERWIAGLAAYRLGLFDQAKLHFSELAADPGEDPWLRAGAGYWAARTASQLGDPVGAKALLRFAAQFPTTFYGMIADRQVRTQTADAGTARFIKAAYVQPRPTVAASFERDDPELVRFAAEEPRAHRAAALAQLGRIDEARYELKAGLARAASASEKSAWNSLIKALNAGPDKQGASSGPRRIWSGPVEYPVPELTPKDGFTVDKALVYAITYQESRFNPSVVSHAGAIGLMQLMPESAARVVGDDKLKRNPAPLYDPAFNLRAGQDYLTWVMDRWTQHDILRTVAAYNGGPGAVLKAIEKLKGDDSDPLMLIECLPAQETRNYVEKVMAAYWSYRRQWGQDTPTLDAVVNGARLIDARLDLVQPDPIGSLMAQAVAGTD